MMFSPSLADISGRGQRRRIGHVKQRVRMRASVCANSVLHAGQSGRSEDIGLRQLDVVVPRAWLSRLSSGLWTGHNEAPAWRNAGQIT